MRRPVVFLDIDGVLHIKGDRAGTLNAECVRALNWLTATADARLVISSVWRGMRGIEALLKREGVAAKVVGKTPQLEHTATCSYLLHGDPAGCSCKGATRGDEIQRWLDLHAPRRFVILDDDADMDGLAGYLVQTSFDRGLTRPLAEVALSHLAVQQMREATA